MVTCDTFDFTARLTGEENFVVEYTLVTDLPVGAQIGLNCQRDYRDGRGKLSVWMGYGEVLKLAPMLDGLNGCSGAIDVNESDKLGVDWFKKANSGYDRHGISTPVGDILTIELTVGARQRMREFGKNNVHLSGKQVFDSGGIHIIRTSRTLLAPMNPVFQPAITPATSGPRGED